MVEIAAPGGGILFTGIDQLRDLLPRAAVSPHPSRPFRCAGTPLVSGQVIGDAGRQADAEVDVSAFRNIAGHALGHFVTGQFCMSGSSGALCGSQVFQREDALDEMPGVMMFSGSRSPSATSCETSTMVVFAAVAMIGPKLRAALR